MRRAQELPTPGVLARAMALAVALCAGPVVVGCAHEEVARHERLSERRLVVLEREFFAFTARPLDRAPDGTRIDPFAGVDDAVSDLERLRLRYLDALQAADTDRARMHALVRIAELHLDLGARIRRIPYPPLATPQAQRAFDERLSQLALPHEAVGLGVLEQAVDYAARRGLETRLSRRARLYLALHTDARALSREDVQVLQRELTARGPFAAPRTLLEAGRIGQRAARR